MPHTRWTFLICCLAIAGIPRSPASGRRTRSSAACCARRWPPRPHIPATLELVLRHHLGHFLYGAAARRRLHGVLHVRLYFLVLRGGDVPRHGDEPRRARRAATLRHESPPAMTVVLWILALGVVRRRLPRHPRACSARVPRIDCFGEWLRRCCRRWRRKRARPSSGIVARHRHRRLAARHRPGLDALRRRRLGRVGEALRRRASPRLYKLVFNKYYIDEVYDFLVVRPIR